MNLSRHRMVLFFLFINCFFFVIFSENMFFILLIFMHMFKFFIFFYFIFFAMISCLKMCDSVIMFWTFSKHEKVWMIDGLIDWLLLNPLYRKCRAFFYTPFFTHYPKRSKYYFFSPEPISNHKKRLKLGSKITTENGSCLSYWRLFWLSQNNLDAFSTQFRSKAIKKHLTMRWNKIKDKD